MKKQYSGKQARPETPLWASASTWMLNLLFKRLILVLACMFCIGVGMALSSMNHLSHNLIETHALQNATLSARAINQSRIFYSEEVVDRLRSVEGLTITHNYQKKDKAIPIPATYTIEIGSQLTAESPGSLFRLYSDYPFPSRQAEGGARDVFEQEALDYLKQHPEQTFFRIENYQGQTAFRYAEAVTMEQSCVSCHNTHPESPKTDWKVGEVRGILEIAQPLNPFMIQIDRGLQGTFVMLGGLSALGISGLTLVIGKLRRTAKELEQRVRERTADLAIANQDLEKRNALISQVFGRYLNSEVVANLLEKPGALKLGGDRKAITILSSDLRGFTALAERLSPEEVVQILNLYLKHMSEVISSYHGTIDKFMGDGILVLFGAPTPRVDDAERAVACAVAMQLAMVPVNQKMMQWGHQPLEMGIGINTGDVVVGNIGSEQRADYSAVGSQVNLTYRIESYTTGGQILISASTLQSVETIVRIDGQQQVKPKGVAQDIIIYQVGGIGGSYNLFLPDATEVLLSLSDAIALRYTLLDGKHVGEHVCYGSLIQLSDRGAKICSNQNCQDSLPSGLSNIKLNLLNEIENAAGNEGIADYSDDIYAKVTAIQSVAASFEIRFTSQPPAVRSRLSTLYRSLAIANSGSP